MTDSQTTGVTASEDDHGGIVDAHCVGCGLDRSNDPSITSTRRTPCPSCGKTGLNFVRTLTASVTASASLSTSLSPGVQDRDWRLKWKQLERRLPRVTGQRAEPRSGDATHSAAQDLFEFFVSAFHLSDALIEDGALTKQDVERAMKQSDTLSLLRDLAILDKHRQMSSQPWSGAVPRVSKVSDVSDGPDWQLVLSISHKGRMIDGVAFATRAVEEWRLHLQSWNLL